VHNRPETETGAGNQNAGTVSPKSNRSPRNAAARCAQWPLAYVSITTELTYSGASGGNASTWSKMIMSFAPLVLMHGLVGDTLGSGVKASGQLLQRLRPPIWNEPPTHWHKLVTASFGRRYDLNRVGRRDVVGRSKSGTCTGPSKRRCGTMRGHCLSLIVAAIPTRRHQRVAALID
jgi:hypothetical protein